MSLTPNTINQFVGSNHPCGQDHMVCNVGMGPYNANCMMDYKLARPSCSKLTMSLVNDLLKFTSSDTQICCNFLLKKCE